MSLHEPLKNFLRLKPDQEKILEKFGISTVHDLLFHFPARYGNILPLKSVADLSKGDSAQVVGKILDGKLEKTWRKKLRIAEVKISDGTGVIRAVWFHQPYMANILKKGISVSLSGAVGQDKYGLYLANPNYSLQGAEEMPNDTSLTPVYPETKGLSSRWIRYAVRKVLAQLSAEAYQDIIPSAILKKYNLPALRNALLFIHMPRNLSDAKAARKRFAFEEIFLIQLARMRDKMTRAKEPALSITKNPKDFLVSLPYELTRAQDKAIKDIANDLRGSSPMARLLEGDVGSGKTVVAAAASYAAIQNGYQVAYMAPTEVLARQHFKEFTERFAAAGQKIKIGLLTSAECLKFPSKVRPGDSTHIARSQLLRWVLQGETPMLIGTHALIQDKVRFKNLALVIVDEQHRFGVRQRSRLAKKEKTFTPHLLSMTATPIPRTLALTVYGDLDLTLLDEMPPGRKKTVTEVVPPSERAAAYEKIRGELTAGRQAYVVCPRIDKPDENAESILTLNMNPVRNQRRQSTVPLKSPVSNGVKAVKEEQKRLAKEIFPAFTVGMLHGQMKPAEKETSMRAFREGRTQILVATSVIEVGVNIPNATIMLIEGAERFGLAQLHQLRGRVVRSIHQPYCFIFTESSSAKTLERLSALTRAENGFELAEYDLMFRGAGELSGNKQWGITDVGMEALKNLKMVEAARSESEHMLTADPQLQKYPALREILDKKRDMHWE